MERTEVAPSRLAEFKAIEEKVDAEAERGKERAGSEAANLKP